jgi:formylglycine-generating enzyme required for sulfatase activity
MIRRPSALWIAVALVPLCSPPACGAAQPAEAIENAAAASLDDPDDVVAVRLSACPPDMAKIGASCIDRFEAPNVRGAKPLVMRSAPEGEAWCRERGKRLCTEDEWDLACEGPPRASGTELWGEAPRGRAYPYGDLREEGACNDGKRWIEYQQPLLDTWPGEPAEAEVLRLYQAAPSGSYERCVSPFGVYDLLGNVEEWVVRSQPHRVNFEHALKGCYWAGCYGGNKPTCDWTNSAHAGPFRFYEIGFRCCMDAR